MLLICWSTGCDGDKAEKRRMLGCRYCYWHFGIEQQRFLVICFDQRPWSPIVAVASNLNLERLKRAERHTKVCLDVFFGRPKLNLDQIGTLVD